MDFGENEATWATNIKETNQQNEEVIVDNIIEERDRKKEVVINKKHKTLLKDEVLEYGEEEDTIDYVLWLCSFHNLWIDR